MAPGEKKMFAKGKGSFLLSADLSADPDARLGRRKRARLKKEGSGGAQELSAEMRPRAQQQWMEEHRRQTKLPTAAGDAADADAADARPGKKGGLGPEGGAADGAMGRKKQKRLSVLESKKAKKQAKQNHAERRNTEDANKASQGKAQKGDLSQASMELVEKYRGSAVGEQRCLAICADRVSGAPEKEIQCFDVFFELHATGVDARTRQLALLSAIAVFRDLVPGYRIREPTEQEKATLRSKPVLQLEKYELALLSKYRRLLPVLEAALKKDPVTYAPALAALIVCASEFNYRQRLLATAVKYCSADEEEARKVIADALREMVENDKRLEASREVVLAVGRIAQTAAQNVSRGGGHGTLKQELVEVMLSLPLGKIEAAALREGEALDVDADDETKRALAEASLSAGVERVKKAEAELLTEVFVVYLRILRQRQVHGRELLVSALTGLSRWGQQVNIELLLEILAELKGAVKDATDRGDELVGLHGLNCALVLLSGDSQALLTDVTWLADSLKVALTLAVASMHTSHSESATWPPERCFSLEKEEGGKSRLCVNQAELRRALEEYSVPALVLRCVEAAIKCPQAYGRASDAALATLVEQLFNLALASDAHVGLAMLQEGALLLRKHQRLHSLLDSEGGLFGVGGLKEHAITLVWHLQALCFSLVPEVVKAAKGLPGAIPKYARVSMQDQFPTKDGISWLAAEAARHLGAGLADPALAPGGGPAGQRKGSDRGIGKPRVAAFLSEEEVIAACGNS